MYSNIDGQITNNLSKNLYYGGETNTAIVYVDNINNIITADAKIDVDEVNKKLEKVNANYDAMIYKASLLDEDYKEVSSKLRSLQSDFVQLEARVTDMGLSCDAKLSEMDKRINDLRATIDTKISSVQEQIDLINFDITNRINIKIEDLYKQIDILKVEITKINSSIDNVVLIVDNLRELIVSIDTELRAYIDKIKAETIEAVSNLSKETKEKFTEVDSNLDLLRQNLYVIKALLETEISNLGEELTKKINDCDSKLTKEIDTKADLSDLDAEIQFTKSLDVKIDATKLIINECIATLRNYVDLKLEGKVDNDTLDAEVKVLNNRITGLSEDVDEQFINLKLELKDKLSKKLDSSEVDKIIAELKTYTDTAITTVTEKFNLIIADVLNTLQREDRRIEDRVDYIHKSTLPKLELKLQGEIEDLKEYVDNSDKVLDLKIDSTKEEFLIADTLLNTKIDVFAEKFDKADILLDTKINCVHNKLNEKIESEISKSGMHIDEKLETLKKYVDNSEIVLNGKMDAVEEKLLIANYVLSAKCSAENEELKKSDTLLDIKINVLFNKLNAKLDDYYLKITSEWQEALTNLVDDFGPRILELETKVEANYTELKAEITLVKESLLSKITVLENQFTTLRNDFDTYKNETEAKFTQIDTKFDEVDTKFTDVNAKFDEVDTKFTTLSNSKAMALYYDAEGKYDPEGKGNKYWWMSSSKDNPENTRISGPYNFKV